LRALARALTAVAGDRAGLTAPVLRGLAGAFDDALAGAFDGDFAPRAPILRAPAPLDFASASAAVLSAAGRFPGGLLVTTAVGRS
jgi:hypothetical protein